jgi:putative membrane protein
MKGIHLILKDLQMMWHHKHGRIALIFLLIVPLIYSGFFIAGYWNPYGRLDKLPVAVVNLDKGSTMDNKPIDAGRDFVKSLKENKDLNFKFVSKEKANTGLKDGKFYMILTIPKDFSHKVSTLMDEHPQPAKLIYKINPGKNYVASQISTTATEKMKTKIANSITKSYAKGVFSKFKELAKGLSDASDGAAEINQGTIKAKNGMVQLSDGVHRLNDGSERLKKGSIQLLQGQQKLNNGIDGLSNGSLALSNGLSQLSAGHDKLASGIDDLTVGTKTLAQGNSNLVQVQAKANSTANDLVKTVETYLQSHPEAKDDPAFQQIVAMSNGLSKVTDSLNSGQLKLAKGADQLVQGQEHLQKGMKQFGDKMNEASNGAKNLANGTMQFASGLSQWEQGFSSLNNGINVVANGGNQLDNGANKLVDGLGQLTAGSNELAMKLNDAAKKTSSVHNNDELTSMFSEPVQLVESELSTVPNYGTGITPYFLSLAFYVGGIMAANILPLGRRENLKVSGTVHFFNKLGLKYSIGLIQTLLVDLVVLFGFKLHVASVPLFLISSVIVSFTFMTFILMLVTVFGVAGKFMAVTLLVLQLATCGGTFPGELGNPILSWIGQVLPMAHSLRGFQDVISLGDWAQLQQQIVILLFYLIVAAGIGWATSHVQHSKTAMDPSH